MVYNTGDDAEIWDKPFGVYSFLCVLLRPRSKGTVRLTSDNPRAKIAIDPRFLSNPAGYAPLRAAVRLARRLSEQVNKQGFVAMVPPT